MDLNSIRTFNVDSVVAFLRSELSRSSWGADLYSAALESLRQIDAEPVRLLAGYIVTSLRSELKEAGAEKDWNRIVQLGVHEETLAAIFALHGFLPFLEHRLRTFLGDEQDRKRKAKALRKAAQVMDEITSHTRPWSDELLRSYHLNALVASPSVAAGSLHLYANLMFLREQLLTAFDANSAQEIAKYTFASTVRRITGKYHDREVSGIMGVFLMKLDYDETAHRVWRVRTLRRLDRTSSAFPILLHAFNSALLQPSSGSSPQR